VPRPVDGGVAFLVDKSEGRPSFEVVERIRSQTGALKVGHAGTLDPLATGLLIVLVARPATRLQEAFVHLEKTYKGTMRLGETTPSHDAETEVTDRAEVSGLSLNRIEAAKEEYVGSFWQTPPLYSAVKVDGKRLYEKARRGESARRPPRRVDIDAFELLAWTPPDLDFRVVCSKGTYIRALARDLGEDIGVGAHLTALRRTAIKTYSVDSAWSLDALEAALSNQRTDQS